jgi:hypothetical protein
MESALIALVCQPDSGDVKRLIALWQRSLPGWNEQKFSIRVNKAKNKPGAAHAIYTDIFPSYPFHL